MPAAFDACVKNGGRVRTRTLPNGRYIRICYKGGKSYPGEVRKSKKATIREHLHDAMKEHEKDKE